MCLSQYLLYELSLFLFRFHSNATISIQTIRKMSFRSSNISCALVPKRSFRCSYFRYDENPAKRNLDGIERLGLSWMETLEGLPAPPMVDGLRQPSIRERLIPSASNGPNPFSIPREPRCTFPRRALGAGSQMPIRHLSSN